MSFSKLSLIAVAATLALGSAAAHADSLTLGGAGDSIKFKFGSTTETASGGNFTPSSAVIGGKTVTFDAIYCVDLNHTINDNSFYNNVLFTTNGSVNGSTVHNAADIAWLILNTTVTNETQAAGLQAAIWEEEYGSSFTLLSTGTIASEETADLFALNHAGTISNSLIADLDWITPPTVTEGSGRDRQTVDQQGLVGLVNDPPPAVPEPATLSLFGTGILGLAGFVRRRLTA
jgi:PEP-CTERM motif/Thioester domain